MDSPDDVMYVPVPCLCEGKVTSRIKDTETWEVIITNSPVGEMSGPITATLTAQPGQEENIKPGDYVSIMVTLNFGGVDNRFTGEIYPGSKNCILGTLLHRSIFKTKVFSAFTNPDVDRITFLNKYSGAGIVATNAGKTILTSGGSIYSVLDPYGFGINENLHKTMAQNHQRVVSHNPPNYFAQEHFGMYSGKSLDDKSTRLLPDDYEVVFRRFVTQTRSPNNWVSTCEGTWAPWVGANIEQSTVKKGKEVLFSKAVNHGDTRMTLEVGDPGSAFMTLRLDKVNVGEKTIPLDGSATPALMGNKFKMVIGDDGSLDIRAGGAGIPGANKNAFKMSVDKDGNLTIQAAKNITLTHGDADKGINSFSMDPKKGIDFVTKNGFRVNGRALVNERFLDWMWRSKDFFCQGSAPGGPAPINPLLHAILKTNIGAIDDATGFTTKNKGVPATSTTLDDDLWRSAG